ncbi:MAG: tRNA cyclic N6-threonylcarbamoyladenosine(37) synthase TcdA [Gammaproteobacteria bacterium]|nr:tRNA cyclic N6-threonylcarbamoyladenosine(37) synthase TcdA [Gammaproteobacteria bacterium]MDH5735099.1 tRNA cyclic N6-threonylcarbamoyladenosine(37) synthase TcdA [Gammaproteobacteria bacterium]
MSEYDLRFGGIKRLYGINATESLRKAHICVIGIGGVGSWAVEALARSGIGKITLIDHDDIAASNINRQIHSLTSTLEQSKVEAMSQRIHDINPECVYHIIDDFITDSTLSRHLGPGYDVVIDAIDSIKFKAAIIYYCKRNKIPVITTGGAGGLTDPTSIEVTDLARTWNDPLAAKVRSRLRYEYGYTKNPKRTFGIPCVFSTEQQRYPKADGSVCHAKPGIKGASLDCNFGFGSATFVTATFGFVAAARAIDKIIQLDNKQKTT